MRFAPRSPQSLGSSSEVRALDRGAIQLGASPVANSRICTHRRSSISVFRARFRPSYALIRVRAFDQEGRSGLNLSSTRLLTSNRLPRWRVEQRLRPASRANDT